MKAVSLALLFFCVPMSAFAKIYKWVDASGNTHYSQFAPAGQKSTNVIIPKHKPQPTATSEQTSIEATSTLNAMAGKENNVSFEDISDAESKSEK